MMQASPSQESPERSHTNAKSTSWMILWAALTWILNILFFILLVYVFTTGKKETIVQGFGCMIKKPWSDWDGVLDVYTDVAENMGTVVPSQNAVDEILSNVMRKMRCHGNYADQTETPLAGGIPGAVGTDVVSETFQFSAETCACMHECHTKVFTLRYLSVLTNPSINLPALLQSYRQDVMRKCLFNKRPPHYMTVDRSCFLSVSPYMVVLYANTVAGIFSALYLMKQESSPSVMWRLATAFAILVNTIVGIIGVVFSSHSASTIASIILLEAVSLVVVAFLVSRIQRESDGGTQSLSNTRVTAIKLRNIKKNILMMQRMAFWVQYTLTLPGIVLLYDSMQQQRSYEYLVGRVLSAMGIGFLATGCDILCITVKKISSASNPKHAGLVEVLHSAAWWCWYSWALALLMLAYTSHPLSLPWTSTDLVQGASTMIPLAFSIYTYGILLVGMPIVTNTHYSVRDHSSLVLSVRLCLDLVTRLILILTVFFWVTPMDQYH